MPCIRPIGPIRPMPLPSTSEGRKGYKHMAKIFKQARAAVGIHTQDPPVRTMQPRLRSRFERGPRRTRWPDAHPMPAHYIRRQVLPCPACRRVLLDSGRQAVCCRSTGAQIVHLYCHACGHTWKLPVKRL